MDIFVYIIAVALLLGGFVFLSRSGRTRRFGIILVCVAVVAELFLFNFHSFHLIGGEYDEIDLGVEDARRIGFKLGSDDIVSNSKGAECSIEFENIDKKIGTLKIELEYPDDIYDAKPASKVDVAIDVAGDVHSEYLYDDIASATVINGNERSEYVVLQLSGNVDRLKLNFLTEEGKVFEVKAVKANLPKPMELSTLRLVSMVGIVFSLYALLTLPSLKETCDSKKRLFSMSVAGVTVTFASIAVFIVVLTNLNIGYAPINFVGRTYGDQITQEIVDAFKAGQLHLLDAPSEELLALENPYDWSQRVNSGVDFKMDHLLYDGKYYSYYGIAPVLLLFLPYTLITGLYFPTAEAVLLFSVVGIVFLGLLYFEIVKRFFGGLRINIAIASLIILQLSSGILFCCCTPLFYEIAQSSGFMFTMMGAYFLIRSGVIGDGKISRACLVLSSLFLSLSVLCRPTLAVYCVVALVFIALGFFKDRALAKEEGASTVRRAVSYLTSALTCFAVIGSVQMLYNYVRFGSVFDFGIQYSLTINDFTRAEFYPDFTMIGFWNYLFAFPIVDFDFPFVFSNFSRLGINGFYFAANESAVGIFWRALPTFGYVGAAAAVRRLEKGKRAKALLGVIPACIVAPLVIIFSVWESGYGIRYSVDFAVQIILGGMMILYFLLLKCKEEGSNTVLKFAEAFFAVSVLVAFLITFAMLYDYFVKTGYLATEFLSFERIFEFWR